MDSKCGAASLDCPGGCGHREIGGEGAGPPSSQNPSLFCKNSLAPSKPAGSALSQPQFPGVLGSGRAGANSAPAQTRGLPAPSGKVQAAVPGRHLRSNLRISARSLCFQQLPPSALFPVCLSWLTDCALHLPGASSLPLFLNYLLLSSLLTLSCISS